MPGGLRNVATSFLSIYICTYRQGVPVEACGLGSKNCCMQQKRCILSMSHVTLQCQRVPFGPKWAWRVERPLLRLVPEGSDSGFPMSAVTGSCQKGAQPWKQAFCTKDSSKELPSELSAPGANLVIMRGATQQSRHSCIPRWCQGKRLFPHLNSIRSTS
jgi:hypothetical protein